ncbi:hypothetical protein [Paraburkholderia sp. J8-2]|uniref:hypothetical protein n=1 Tax=Paraburkholderia sp. J8-2 TaxID=2805440 RepID=UPI002AB70B71|nr:hypothetical protein [Paraburkholderia sp. J8-2]
MPHRPPLTATRPVEIWEECPQPLVLELRWEIHRLRATIMRAHQIRSLLGSRGSGVVPSTLFGVASNESLTPSPASRTSPRRASKP